MSLVGNLEDLGLAEILQIINLSRKSGLLSIEHDGKTYVIVFKNGQVISAYEKGSKRHIGHALIERGLMTTQEFNEIARMYKEKGHRSETLKEFIIRKTDLPRELIEDAVVEEVEEVVFKIFAFTEGQFAFELIETEKELFEKIPKGLAYLDSGLNPQYLAMEAVRIREEAFRGIGEEEEEKEEKSQDGYERLVFNELDSYDIDSAPERDAWAILRSFIYELAIPGGSTDVSLMVLRFAGEIFRRAVMFAVRRNSFMGIGAVAEPGSGVDPQKVKGIVLPVEDDSILRDAYVHKRPVRRRLIMESEGDRKLKEALGGFEPAEAYAAPLLVAGRVAAVLYCDNAPDTKEVPDTSALEVFMLQAGLVMEKMLLERKIKEKVQ